MGVTPDLKKSLLEQVMCDPEHKENFRGFFDNVLNQINSTKFFQISDQLCSRPEVSEAHTHFSPYEYIKTQITAQKLSPSIWTKLEALRLQVELLTLQTKQLIPSTDQASKNNVLQIGNAGAYISSLQQKLHLHGTAYMIDENNSWLGYAQNFAFRPSAKFHSFDQYVPLNDYEPISENVIPSNSVGLVVCYIGLHHIPSDKLNPFVQSIHRILAPGGSFVLRDHDIKNDNINLYAHVAHTVFNAVTAQEDVIDELNEVRNFQPLSYWKALMSNHSFIVHDSEILQDGDPTFNTLLRFTKEHTLHSKATKRNPHNTFFVVSEWNDVEQADARAIFMKTQPAYKYSYFRDAVTSGILGAKSWWQGVKHYGLEVTFDEFNMMNAFISTTSVITNLYNGFKSFPYYLLGNDKAMLEWQNHIGMHKDYADFIHHTPWYQFDFMHYAVKAGNFFSAPLFWLECRINQLVANQIKSASGDDLTIDVQLAPGKIVTQELLRQINVNSKVIDANKDGTLINTPRYEELTKTVYALVSKGLEITHIAGNDAVNCLVVGGTARLSNICAVDDLCRPLYSWSSPLKGETYNNIRIEVDKLSNLIGILEHTDLHLKHIYDF